MSTIIKSISFKNFYNYSGDYENNTYEFSEGINVVNADNGMGKSKLFNGFLWILRDKVYDSDSRTTIDITTSPLKILSDVAKTGSKLTVVSGVKLVYEDSNNQYVIEKSISFTKKNPNASFNNQREWNIGEVVTSVTKCSLSALSRPTIVYDLGEQVSIIRDLISPAMHPYALLQGEAIDNIVDLSDSTTLTSTIETLTDLTSLKQIEKSCQYFSKNARTDLSSQQRSQAINLAAFEEYADSQREIEKQITAVEAELTRYLSEYTLASERAAKLQAQVTNTEDRIRFQTECKNLDKKIADVEANLQKRVSNINNYMFKQAMPWLLINSGDSVQRFGKLRDEYTVARTARKLVHDPQSFATLLPEGSPDDISLKKMLENHQCFVCGRSFEEHSEEERKIKALLSRSESHAKADESDLHLYFDAIQRNVAGYMKTDAIFGAIAEEKKEISRLTDLLKDLRKQRRDAESEYYNYGGSKELFNSDKDTNQIAQYAKAVKDAEMYERYIQQARRRLEDLKLDLDAVERNMSNLDGTKKVPAGYLNLRDVVLDVEQIFVNTRKRIYEEVLEKLEARSNDFYAKLTAGNNVMGGTMVFEKTPYDTIEVKVLTDTGSELTGASEGFQRMKKIAVVMAIISSRLGGGRFMYPFIADAPFSAFGKNFINNFFETVPDVFDQSIILIKDLYDIDDPECLSEDGHKILDSMRSGELKGTFYVNRIPEEADPTNLKTTIVRYK